MNVSKISPRKWLAKALIFAMLVTTLVPMLGTSNVMAATPISITEAAGWLESAYVEWSPVSGASNYAVFVKQASQSDSAYVQLDSELIRQYSGYWRADAVGLAAGSYVMQVVAVSGNGSKVASAVTSSLTVKAHERNGFAWVNGTASGAYNEDGTLKSNAKVFYVTESTKGSLASELDSFADGNYPLAVRLIGNITDFTGLEAGDLLIDNGQNDAGLTIEGIGEDATANGWGIRLKNSSNVEIRNIGIMNVDSSEGDNVGLQQKNDHIWVHNCDFFYGDAGSDADQAKGDGALDTKKSTYVTHSYNHFWDTGKTHLNGNGDTTLNYITYHHNWYDHSDSRHPLVRVSSAVHIYNNLYDGVAKYGMIARLGSSIFAEANYFKDTNSPMLISQQGTDTADGEPIASDAGGMIKSYGNVYDNTTAPVTHKDSSTNFDCYEASSKSETVSSSYKTVKGGNTYSNFDTSSGFYSYTAESASSAKATVEKYAGRVNGGDFDWDFSGASEDRNYDVISGLKSALNSYKTSLVSVGGYTGNVSADGNAPEVEVPDVEESSSTVPSSSAPAESESASKEESSETQSSSTPAVTASVAHNFTTNGKTSSYFTINGNLSTSKGTVSYGGLTLTQCLKMESSTSVAFTTTSDATLTLVFNSANSSNVKVDGTKYTLTNGILTLDLAAGSHTITKADTANLFYIALSTAGEVEESSSTEESSSVVESSSVAPSVEESSEAPSVEESSEVESSSPSTGGASSTVMSNQYVHTYTSQTSYEFNLNDYISDLQVGDEVKITANFKGNTYYGGGLGAMSTVNGGVTWVASQYSNDSSNNSSATLDMVVPYGGGNTIYVQMWWFGSGSVDLYLTIERVGEGSSEEESSTVESSSVEESSSVVESSSVAPSVEESSETPSVEESSEVESSSEATAVSYAHNFTTDGKSSSFFTINGNLSTSKGTVSYNGLTLTQCLKMESSTSIGFTTAADATLTLVFNSANSSNVKVDGTKYTLNNGILTLDLAAGSHTITKADTANLFYMAVGTSGVVENPSVEESSSEAPSVEESSSVAPSEPESTTPVQPATGDIYVSANGKSSASGSQSDPMDFVTALSKISAGKTIWMAPGTYSFTSTILIDENNNGAAGAYKTVRSNGGTVTLDFTGMAESSSNRGIVLDGDYWYFYDIDIKDAGDNGMLLAGNNNVIEMCQFYENHDTGLQLSRYNTSASSISQWPSNNLIKNCTSYNNKDEATTENADGFAAKLTCGEGNVFDGCIAYCNSDDGWDLYAKPETGSIGVVTIKNCVAFGNGKLTTAEGSANGDMNGFKLGGSNGQCPTPHVVTNCLAFNNGAAGFTDNGNGGNLVMKDCTAANNGVYASKGNFNCYRTASGASYTNLLSYADGDASSDKFYGSLKNSIAANSNGKFYYVSSSSYTGSAVKDGTVVSISSSDFVSTSIPGYSSGKYATNYHEVFRNSDGSVNMNGLFEVAGSSALAGYGVGAEF